MDDINRSVYKIINEVENLIPLPPTRQCLICNCLENKLANAINGAAWICPNCKMKIKALFLIHDLVIEKEENV